MKINNKALVCLLLSILTLIFCFTLRKSNIYIIILLWVLWITSFAFGLVESKIATFKNGTKFGGIIVVFVTILSLLMVIFKTVWYFKNKWLWEIR